MAAESEILDRALHLPADKRAELALRLLLSLDQRESDPDAESAWESEIERRLDAVDRREVTLLDWRESVERIRKDLKRRQRQ